MNQGNPLFKSREESPGNWVAIADLMAGLMMVFLLLAIWRSEITNTSDEPIKDEPTAEYPDSPVIPGEDPIDPALEALRNIERQIREALNEEFKDDYTKWSASLLDGNITIRFLDRNIFFEQGESSLKPEFQEILADFFPRYIETLHKDFNKFIREVRIEGHTSSEWRVDNFFEQNPEQFAFIKNMELSQARTRATMEYVLSLPDIAPYEKWVRKKVTANGLSSARLLNSRGEELQDGEKEDRNLSRRVEFSVQVDALKVLQSVHSNR